MAYKDITSKVFAWGISYYLTMYNSNYNYNYWNGNNTRFDTWGDVGCENKTCRGNWSYLLPDSAAKSYLYYYRTSDIHKWVTDTSYSNIKIKEGDNQIKLNNLYGITKVSWLNKQGYTTLNTFATAYLANIHNYKIFSSVSSLLSEYGMTSLGNMSIFEYSDLTENFLSVSNVTISETYEYLQIVSGDEEDYYSGITRNFKVLISTAKNYGVTPSGTYSFNGYSPIFIPDDYTGCFIYSRISITKMLCNAFAVDIYNYLHGISDNDSHTSLFNSTKSDDAW